MYADSLIRLVLIGALDGRQNAFAHMHMRASNRSLRLVTLKGCAPCQSLTPLDDPLNLAGIMNTTSLLTLIWEFVYITTIAISATLNLPPSLTNSPLNSSRLLNSSWALSLQTPIPLPYIFDVPNTSIFLNLGFGWRRRALDPMDMRGLIAISQAIIKETIEAIGPHHILPVSPNGEQEFYRELGDGIEFFVQNVRPFEYFTWDTLGEVVEGLRLYLIVGERYRQTYFNFWEEDAGPVGTGCIRRIEGKRGFS